MSDNYAISLKRTMTLIAALSFMAVLFAVNFSAIFSAHAGAAQLESRSLTLSSSLAGTEVGDSIAGSETNGSAATHTFKFTKSAASDSADRISFEYCDAAVGTCNAPDGLDLTAVTATGGTGVTVSNPSVSGSKVTVEATSLSAGAAAITVPLGNIENPDVTPVFFVRIELFANSAPATILDEGTVTSAITEGITITTRVTETLGFSTTADIASGVPVPTSSCVPLTGSGAIQMGDPIENTLSITQAYDAYSVFRLYTNASNGVAVQYEGKTLTKGNDEIDEIGASPAFVQTGTEQFGLGIDTTANGGTISNVDTAWTGGAGNILPEADYGLADGAISTSGTGAQFAFVADTPTTLASSDPLEGGYVNCATGAVRYVANVSPLTPSGVYTTTLVYSAVPTY